MGWSCRHTFCLLKNRSDRGLTGLGFDVVVGDAVTPAGAKRFLEAELAATGKVIQDLGIEPE
jgi:hypothetical protein